MDLLFALQATRNRTIDATSQMEALLQGIEVNLIKTSTSSLEAELQLIKTTLDQQLDLVFKVLNWFDLSQQLLLTLRANSK